MSIFHTLFCCFPVCFSMQSVEGKLKSQRRHQGRIRHSQLKSRAKDLFLIGQGMKQLYFDGLLVHALRIT